ncbi:MAG: 50S ribosomal protein L31e [Thermofilum sp.]
MPRKLPDGEHVFTYTIPLRDAYRAPRKKRAKVAIRLLKDFVRRHFRYTGDVAVSRELNEIIWAKSVEKPPRRVKASVKVNVEEGEIVSVELRPVETASKEEAR